MAQTGAVHQNPDAMELSIRGFLKKLCVQTDVWKQEELPTSRALYDKQVTVYYLTSSPPYKAL